MTILHSRITAVIGFLQFMYDSITQNRAMPFANVYRAVEHVKKLLLKLISQKKMKKDVLTEVENKK